MFLIGAALVQFKQMRTYIKYLKLNYLVSCFN